MFSLRYFYVVSFVLIVISAIIAGNMGRSYIEENIIKNMADTNNRTILDAYIPLVWQKNLKTLALLPCASGNCPGIDKLKKDTDDFFKDFHLLKFELYYPDGRNIFSQNGSSNNVTFDKKGRMGFIAAAEGLVTSDLVSSYKIDKKSYNVVRTFLPITYNSDENEHRYVILEIIYNISPFWANPVMIQIIGVVVIFLIATIIFGIMFMATLRTEQLITKQYEANIDLVSAKALAEAENQAKSQFLANVSHELRTPLNAIIGFSEIIKDEVIGPLHNKQYMDYVTDIHMSGVHLLSLINDILDYSKAEAGKLTVDITDVDVTKVMKNSIRLVSPRAAEANVNLVENIPKEHYILKTDGKRLKQVLLNLFSNAVKFTPPEGTVTLYAWNSLADNTFVIEVQDTGVGIEPKNISKVMATFGQVENKLSRKYEGTGLGLPLSKKLVELMNGKLHIKSKLGEGTTVSVILPYIAPKPEEVDPAIKAAEQEKAF